MSTNSDEHKKRLKTLTLTQSYALTARFSLSLSLDISLAEFLAVGLRNALCVSDLCGSGTGSGHRHLSCVFSTTTRSVSCSSSRRDVDTFRINANLFLIAAKGTTKRGA